MIEVVNTFCTRIVAPVGYASMTTVYPVAPGDAFQLRVGVKVLTVTPGGAGLPGDNPVGTDGVGTLAGDTLKLTGFELPPPGGGLVTTSGKLPAIARSVALTVIVRRLVLINEAVCRTSLNVTDDEAMNPLPLIVSVSELVPATTEDGDKLVM